jgi:hypothetical protein
VRIAAVLVLLSAGCYTRPSFDCTRGYTIAHPTMTTETLSIGADARVRHETEGPKSQISVGVAGSAALRN